MSPVDLLADRLFLTAAEAGRVLGVDARSVRRAIEGGQVPGVRVGQQWRVPAAWLRERAHLMGEGGGEPS